MVKTVFPYPGGKTYLAKWILDHFPAHECYVEVFGGGASVLVNKEPSFNEVYNDLDGDLVQFFQVLREQPDELREWLNRVPFSREQHNQFKTAFYNGERPDDNIERAGRFFYLRHSQYAGKYCSPSGFVGMAGRSKARWLRNATKELEDFADRFTDVTVENLDFEALIELYDSPETLFYCDPPYVEEGDALYSHEDAFNHGRLAKTLSNIEGRFICSYMDIPDELSNADLSIKERESTQHMNKNHETRRESAIERLVMNFNPKEMPLHSGTEQQRLTEVV